MPAFIGEAVKNACPAGRDGFPDAGPLKVARCAFTLIELLVVVSIIGVLVALLVPAIGRMRTKANTARSLSNLRQIGMATFAFAAEHNSRVPNGWGYEQVLSPYLGDPKQKHTVFASPNADRQPYDMGSATPITYSVHGRVFDLGSLIGVQLGSIRRPGSLIIVADGNQSPSNFWQVNWHFENPADYVYGKFDDFTEPELKEPLKADTSSKGVGPDIATGWAGWFRYCNDGAVNALMADGHAESIRKGEVLAENLVAF